MYWCVATSQVEYSSKKERLQRAERRAARHMLQWPQNHLKMWIKLIFDRTGLQLRSRQTLTLSWSHSIRHEYERATNLVSDEPVSEIQTSGCDKCDLHWIYSCTARVKAQSSIFDHCSRPGCRRSGRSPICTGEHNLVRLAVFHTPIS